MAYLTRKSGGRYHVRVRVPLDLVPLVGRQEIRRSLRSSDPRAARLHSGRLAAAIMDALEKVRMTGDKDALEKEVAEAAKACVDTSYVEGVEAIVRAQKPLRGALTRPLDPAPSPVRLFGRGFWGGALDEGNARMGER